MAFGIVTGQRKCETVDSSGDGDESLQSQGVKKDSRRLAPSLCYIYALAVVMPNSTFHHDGARE